jgi:DNA-binding NtrC family response regulator
MTRIAICPASPHAETVPLHVLVEEGHEIVRCESAVELLECMATQPPGAVLYFLDRNPETDLALLRLIRRTAPQLPLILVATHGSLRFQELIQALRPVYYTMAPLDRAELSAAVRRADHRSGGHAAPEPEDPTRTKGSGPKSSRGKVTP